MISEEQNVIARVALVLDQKHKTVIERMRRIRRVVDKYYSDLEKAKRKDEMFDVIEALKAI